MTELPNQRSGVKYSQSCYRYFLLQSWVMVPLFQTALKVWSVFWIIVPLSCLIVWHIPESVEYSHFCTCNASQYPSSQRWILSPHFLTVGKTVLLHIHAVLHCSDFKEKLFLSTAVNKISIIFTWKIPHSISFVHRYLSSYTQWHCVNSTGGTHHTWDSWYNIIVIHTSVNIISLMQL